VRIDENCWLKSFQKIGRILDYAVKGSAVSKLKHLVPGGFVHDDHLGGQGSWILVDSILLLDLLEAIYEAVVICFEVEVGYGQEETLIVL
jgi:hypothetical protein